MKELEKYLKKEYPHLSSGDKMFAWALWKAALEWAKKQTGKHWDFNDDHVFHIKMDLIDKELKEVQQDE